MASETKLDHEPEKETRLDTEERRAVEEIGVFSPSVIFEAIRREGDHELSRPLSALWWSGVAAGLAISCSVLFKGFLTSVLPDTTWAPAITNLGYSVGFVIVILAQMQLFTENTITPILPLFLNPTRRNFSRTARLWGIVFAANLAGCLLAAAVFTKGGIVTAERFAGILEISRHYAHRSAEDHFYMGIPAGFLIAALVWIMPRMADSGEVMMIVIITYFIGLGDMSHVVAGATELFVMVFQGELSVGHAVTSGILPALAGNVLGGTGIFSAMTYAQVREEL